MPSLKSTLLGIQHFFVTIATIIGTGILGLPVRLANSGFAPFLLSFSFCLIMQLAAIFVMTELIQRAHCYLDPSCFDRAANAEDESSESLGFFETLRQLTKKKKSEVPSLHLIGRLFLNTPLSILFNFTFFCSACTVLISYALAGSQTYGQLLGVNPSKVLIAPFVLVYTTIVLLGAHALQPVIGSLTIIKCCFLVAMMAVVGVVGSTAAVKAANDWSSIGQPFLIGVVTLTGVQGVLPVMYDKAPKTAAGVRQLRNCCCAGLVTCYGLNALWSAFVLEIVPQSPAQLSQLQHMSPNHAPITPTTSGPALNLQTAASRGQIATVPVIAVLRRFFPQFMWVADLVGAFILLSVTVSYLTTAVALRHFLDGAVRDFIATAKHCPPLITPRHATGTGTGTGSSSSGLLAGSAELPPLSSDEDAAGAAAEEGRQPHTSMHSPLLANQAPSSASDPLSGSGSSARGVPIGCASRLYHALPTVLQSQTALSLLACLSSFGFILAVALGDPRGFLVLLGTFGTLFGGLNGGVLIGIMVVTTALRSSRPIPLPMTYPRTVAWFAILTFAVTVVYDIEHFIATKVAGH